ncbi:hypothetical protein HispidOSU_024029, partial [Sigmodon hispidus]
KPYERDVSPAQAEASEQSHIRSIASSTKMILYGSDLSCWVVTYFSRVYRACLLISFNWIAWLATKWDPGGSKNSDDILLASLLQPRQIENERRKPAQRKPSKLESENKLNLENCSNHLIW